MLCRVALGNWETGKHIHFPATGMSRAVMNNLGCVGSLEVLNKISCTICLGVNAQNFKFNVSIHGVGTFDYLCMSIKNNIFSCINDNR